MNQAALKIASEVAKESGTLFAGNICNSGAYDPDNKEVSEAEVYKQYSEQIDWAVDAGVDDRPDRGDRPGTRHDRPGGSGWRGWPRHCRPAGTAAT